MPSLKNDGMSELRFGMVLTDFYLREEEYKMQAVPGHGEGGGVSRRKGQAWVNMKKDFIRNGIKYLPVILERS